MGPPPLDVLTRFRGICDALYQRVQEEKDWRYESDLLYSGMSHWQSDESRYPPIQVGDEILYPVAHGSTRGVWRWGEYVIKIGLACSRAPGHSSSPNFREASIFTFVKGTPIEKFFVPTYAYYSPGQEQEELAVNQWPRRSPRQPDFVLADYVVLAGPSHKSRDAFEGELDEVFPSYKEFFSVGDFCDFNFSTNPEWLVHDYGGFQIQ